VIQPRPELRAEHLCLRQRDQELPGRQAPIPLLDRTESVIQRGGQPQAGDHFGLS